MQSSAVSTKLFQTQWKNIFLKTFSTVLLKSGFNCSTFTAVLKAVSQVLFSQFDFLIKTEYDCLEGLCAFRASAFFYACPSHHRVFSINPPIIKILCKRQTGRQAGLFPPQPLGGRECLASQKWEHAADRRRGKGGARNEWSVGNGGEGVEGPIEAWGPRMQDIIANAWLRIHV